MNVPNDISAIAKIIDRDWKNMYFGARPYVDAMYSLHTVDDTYGSDTAPSIVNYFLGNAKTWRGETAREVKKKLQQLLQTSIAK